MEEDGYAFVAIVRRNESGCFSLLCCDSKRCEREGAWFCPIVSWGILEGSIITTKENGEVTRLEIDNSHVSTTIAVEVSSKPKIRPCVGPAISPWLERPITITQKSRK